MIQNSDAKWTYHAPPALASGVVGLACEISDAAWEWCLWPHPGISLPPPFNKLLADLPLDLDPGWPEAPCSVL
jgi:hypothetical protein